jgi:hypothetical protein
LQTKQWGKWEKSNGSFRYDLNEKCKNKWYKNSKNKMKLKKKKESQKIIFMILIINKNKILVYGKNN